MVFAKVETKKEISLFFFFFEDYFLYRKIYIYPYNEGSPYQGRLNLLFAKTGASKKNKTPQAFS